MPGVVGVEGVAPFTRNVVIPSGQAMSGGVDLTGGKLVGLDMPTAWTAAAITLQTSADGVTWLDVYTETGSEFSITTTQARHILVPMSRTMGLQWLRLRSGTGAAPVNQAADRTIGLRISP